MLHFSFHFYVKSSHYQYVLKQLDAQSYTTAELGLLFDRNFNYENGKEIRGDFVLFRPASTHFTRFYLNSICDT